MISHNMQPTTQTLKIDKFNGRLTRFRNGDINSGMAVQYSGNTSWGYDAQQQSGILMFNQLAYSIKGSVITDLVVAGRIKVENGTSFLYAIGHTGRFYKIQVNNTSTNNPDYDNPVLLGTLANSQTFKYGASIQFFFVSGTEYVWIGHDAGVTKINFDGTGETVIGTVGPSAWINAVPRQSQQFIGSLFYTNGSNIAQIDSTGTVTNYQKITPGFPSTMLARDIHSTADGRYLVMAVTRSVLGDQTAITVDTNIITSTDSMLVYWNGTDIASSSSTGFSFPATSYYTFAGYEYIFAEQIGGAMLGTPQSVINVLEFENCPLPNAIASSGDYLGWFSTRFIGGKLYAVINLYGTIDNETPTGFYKQLIQASTLTGGDVVRVPFATTVSSWQSSGVTSGYTNTPFQLFGTGKSYFSTLEYNGSTTKYDFYAFKNVLDFQNAAALGNYQTQTELFSKQIKPTEVRVYMESFSSSTSFKIDLIGIDGNVLTGGTKTFSSTDQASNRCKFNPTVGATPALGLRITNVGVVTPIIHKVEIDVSEFGN